MTDVVDRDLIEPIADDLGLRIRDDYSGRYMFGDRCFGLVAEEPNTIEAFWVRLGAADATVAERLAGAVRTDGMGLGTIHYFPGFTLTPEDDA